MKLMAKGHIDDEVPDAGKWEILDPEIGLFQAPAVRHVLMVDGIPRLMKPCLQGGEDVLMGAVRGAIMLVTAVQMITIGVNVKTSARAGGGCWHPASSIKQLIMVFAYSV